MIPDPIGWLNDYSTSSRVVNFRVWTHHGTGTGHLEQSALTGNVRSRYQFDHQWTCEECRPYKEKAEANRILTAFERDDMWFSTYQGDRTKVAEQADGAGVSYVTIPLGSNFFAVLTTGPICDESVEVEDPGCLVRDAIMPLRWVGHLSSSRGFLPPAREYEFWERYHKDTKRRCWHLHPSPRDASQCQIPLELDGSTKGWYVRGTSEYHKIGRIEVTGEALVRLLGECHLGFAFGTDGVAEVVLDPVVWTDPRFQDFLNLAGWEPPDAGFQPPPLAIRVKVDTRRGRLSGGSLH